MIPPLESPTAVAEPAAPTILVQLTDLHIREPGRLAYGASTPRSISAAMRRVGAGVEAAARTPS